MKNGLPANFAVWMERLAGEGGTPQTFSYKPQAVSRCRDRGIQRKVGPRGVNRKSVSPPLWGGCSLRSAAPDGLQRYLGCSG